MKNHKLFLWGWWGRADPDASSPNSTSIMHAFGRGKRTLPVLPTQRAAAMELVVVRGDGESHVLHAREAKSRVHTGLIVVVRVEGITRHLRRKATDLHGGGGVSGGDGGVEGEARLQWRRIW